jgi:hypothetical protein
MPSNTAKSLAASGTNQHTTKRKRSEPDASDSSSSSQEYVPLVKRHASNLIDNSYRDEIPSQLLVLVAVNTLAVKIERTSQGMVTSKSSRKILMFIPEHIVRQITKYAALLEKAARKKQVEGDPIFTDDIKHNDQAFVQVIECVGGASLQPLTGSADEVKATLEDLLTMCGVAVALQIRVLEDAIIDHIQTCPNTPVEVFLDFAKFAYAGNRSIEMKAHATDSPIGKLINRKFAILLPQFLKNGLAQRIKAEGGTLSTELLEVIIEQPSAKGGIKVET